MSNGMIKGRTPVYRTNLTPASGTTEGSLPERKAGMLVGRTPVYRNQNQGPSGSATGSLPERKAGMLAGRTPVYRLRGGGCVVFEDWTPNYIPADIYPSNDYVFKNTSSTGVAWLMGNGASQYTEDGWAVSGMGNPSLTHAGDAMLTLYKNERAQGDGRGFPWDNYSWEMTTRLLMEDPQYGPKGDYTFSFFPQGRRIDTEITLFYDAGFPFTSNQVTGRVYDVGNPNTLPAATIPLVSDLQIAFRYDVAEGWFVWVWETGTERPSSPTTSLAFDWTASLTNADTDKTDGTSSMFMYWYELGLPVSGNIPVAKIGPLTFCPVEGGTPGYYQPASGPGWPVFPLG